MKDEDLHKQKLSEMEAHKEMQDKANAESKKAKHRPRTSIMRDDPAGITNATSSISEKLKSLGAKAQYPHADGDYDGLPNIEENELELTRQKSKAVEEEFMPKNNDLVAAAGIQTPVDMTILILDPSHYMPDPLLDLAEEVTRDFCFELHQKRSASLGYSYSYRHKDNILHRHAHRW